MSIYLAISGFIYANENKCYAYNFRLQIYFSEKFNTTSLNNQNDRHLVPFRI